MENLTKTQLVLLVLLVSFITSVVTGIVTAALIEQAPDPLRETIYKVVERVTSGSFEDKNSDDFPTEKSFVITEEDLIIKLAKESSPAVVSIIATKDVPVLEQFFVDPFGNDPSLNDLIPPEFRQIPQLRQKGTEQREISSGSGFLYRGMAF